MQDSSIPTLLRTASMEWNEARSPIGPMLAYWNSLPRRDGIPPRSKIDPDSIRPFLSSCGILERRNSGRVAIRLAGQAIERRFGMPLRGLPLHGLINMEQREELYRALEVLFETPAVVIMSLNGGGGLGSRTPSLRLALMPLCDDDGAPNRAMMVMEAKDAKKIRGDLSLDHIEVAPIAVDATAPVIRANAPVLRVIAGGA